MTFQEAVQKARPPLDTAYREHKTALKKEHAKRIRAQSGRITGSIDIDSTLASTRANQQLHRWDYGLGYCLTAKEDEYAIWIEVHSAETSEVKVVENKLDQLKKYLQTSAPALYDLTQKNKDPATRYIWIASGRINIPRHTRQARRLDQHPELSFPVKHLMLP